MATHPSVLAWRIPGMEEPSGLPSMGSHRVGHNLSDLAAAAAASILAWRIPGTGEPGGLPSMGSHRVGHNLSDLAAAAAAARPPSRFLVSYSFCVFCCSRRGVSRCKHCSEEPQVPGCLSGRWKHRQEKPRTTGAVAGPHLLSKGNPGTRGANDETTFATVRNKGGGGPSTLRCQSSPD